MVSEGGERFLPCANNVLEQVHISASTAQEENPSMAGTAAKLMHRFTEQEVQAKMDIAERS
jgi:hypothetical protein